jgi:hypothetical protein
MFAVRCKARGVAPHLEFLHLVANTDWTQCSLPPDDDRASYLQNSNSTFFLMYAYDYTQHYDVPAFHILHSGNIPITQHSNRLRLSLAQIIHDKIIKSMLIRGTWDIGKQRLYRYYQVLCVLNTVTIPIILQKESSSR